MKEYELSGVDNCRTLGRQKFKGSIQIYGDGGVVGTVEAVPKGLRGLEPLIGVSKENFLRFWRISEDPRFVPLFYNLEESIEGNPIKNLKFDYIGEWSITRGLDLTGNNLFYFKGFRETLKSQNSKRIMEMLRGVSERKMKVLLDKIFKKNISLENLGKNFGDTNVTLMPFASFSA